MKAGTKSKVGSNAAVGRASQLRAICVCTGEGRKRKRTGNRARNVHAGVCPRHPISPISPSLLLKLRNDCRSFRLVYTVMRLRM